MVADAADRAGRREWLGLALLALPLFVLSLDVSVLFLAAPSLSADLDPSGPQLLWILDVYGFAIAGLLITMGKLGDRVGSRRLLVVGSAAFAVASLLAAFATTPAMLIAARALLGIAGATLMPSTLALITRMFRDETQRGFAIAVWMTTFSVGIALGPIVGGALLEHFWWGSVFLPGVPAMLLVVALAPRLLPEQRDPAGSRLDPTSVALSLAAILPVVYGLKQLASHGASAEVALATAVGVVAGGAFVGRQRRLADPLLDLRLLAHRRVAAAVALLLTGITAVSAVNFVTPLFLQSVEGLSPLRVGLWTVPVAVAAVAGSLLAPYLAGRSSVRSVMGGGALLAFLGFVLLTQVPGENGLPVLVAAAAVVVFGLSPLGVLGTAAVLAAAPAERAGSASAMSETSGELGVALGVAGAGTVLTGVYVASLDGEALRGLTPDQADTVREDITGAATIAEALPSSISNAALEPVREALTLGLNSVGALGALLTLALAGVALRTLRT